VWLPDVANVSGREAAAIRLRTRGQFLRLESPPTLESIEGDGRRYHTIGVNGDVVDFMEEQVWCGSCRSAGGNASC
jgi:hypothetical protein